MFGYVRCNTGELLVKHHRLYEAIYCGLCHSVRKNTTVALLPFFSYDFVFLATLRMLLCDVTPEVEGQFCILHPFGKKKQRIKDNPALAHAALASLLLTKEKMEDDLADRDSSPLRRLVIRLTLPSMRRCLKRIKKRESEFSALCDRVHKTMIEGRRIESEGAELDRLCGSFAEALSAVFSYGTEGREQKLLSAMGDLAGRFLYTVDALDDLERDAEKKCYNPLLSAYGTVEEARLHFSELDLVLSFYIAEMKKLLDLTDTDRSEYAVLNNIITLGLPSVVHPMIKPERKKNQ
ncbi:MAG: hypothetical protein IJC84_05080 [Clostridia bacterium]|nr:hypothetical protein [Clostridia bacterium]